MKILRMDLQMFRQLANSFGQNRNLNLGGTGIRLMCPVRRHNFLLFFLTDHVYHLSNKLPRTATYVDPERTSRYRVGEYIITDIRSAQA